MKRLITSALPYVNNVPHLGNLIQVLSGDVFARFCRAKGYQTLYICGTDEYGTATETKALQEGLSPKELCDKFHKIHKEIYDWFNIEFDEFGRTSDSEQTVIVQQIFNELDKNGFIKEHISEQFFCDKCQRFLADRHVKGGCPKCGSANGRGDQCQDCGAMLDPIDLINPKCNTCSSLPHFKSTKHLYIDLPAIAPQLKSWLDKASVEGKWSDNAITTARGWLKDGLKERSITRDLKWGIPVPKAGFEDKVFYVWFDAPIGYISITKHKLGDSYKDWWLNPDTTKLYQFIGKDNIPFHTIIFPSTLIGSGQNFTKLYKMSASEYLNYEDKKFSKTDGIGIFGDDCQATGIPADVWRFYVYYNRPESHDTIFTWQDFKEKVNSELIGNFSNLVNRTLAFINKYYNNEVPPGQLDEELWAEVNKQQQLFMQQMENCEIKHALHNLLHISDIGNKTFQKGEPWHLIKNEPAKAAQLIFNLTYLVRNLALLMDIFIPTTAKKILTMLNSEATWDNLDNFTNLKTINKAEILFKVLDDEEIAGFKTQFDGRQDTKNIKQDKKMTETPAKKPINQNVERNFANTINLVAAKIVKVEKPADAENLYILQLNLGDELGQRQIVSSIVAFYKEDELLDKTIVIVENLKKAKFRGIPSEGMLLAAGNKEATPEECEVIFTEAPAGSRFLPEGIEAEVAKRNISVDRFFGFPLTTLNGAVSYNGKNLVTAAGVKLAANKYTNSPVG
ncbi:MAG: methionine--tRNA ligase [Spirochaetaceae bacterium]|nr:methionine--tRNA ligase [Spirochaetaceae bacterium]